ncbi:hypothetical protein JKY72_05990, partial [Candidatus Gracilibacteria bacterium]|nr:hypothetical protein [Candidatus Gracilibacteria bacterium]
MRIFEGGQYECPSSPCEISSSSGDKTFIIEKEGRQSLVQEIHVDLWGEKAIFAELFINPYIEESLEFPEENVAELVIENKKLLEKNGQIPIVIFQNEVSNVQIYNSHKFALINSDQGAYKVDIK